MRNIGFMSRLWRSLTWSIELRLVDCVHEENEAKTERDRDRIVKGRKGRKGKQACLICIYTLHSIALGQLGQSVAFCIIPLACLLICTNTTKRHVVY